MRAIIRYTLLTASRDWLFIGLFIASLVAIGISITLGSTALVEEFQMTMTYISGSVRLVLITGFILFVCFHVRRSFDNKEIELILSRPISRPNFILSYWLGFVILTLVTAIPILTLITLLNLSTLSQTGISSMLYWSASLVLEISLVVAFALVASLILHSAVSATLSTFGFYVMSRMMGFFIAAGDNTYGFGGGVWGTMGDLTLKTVSIVLPRLDMFGKSNWLVYGIEDASNIWLMQAIIYIPLLLAMAATDFQRKQF